MASRSSPKKFYAPNALANSDHFHFTINYSKCHLRVSALLSRSCLRQLMRKAPQLGFPLAPQCSWCPGPPPTLHRAPTGACHAHACLPRREAILVLRRVTWVWEQRSHVRKVNELCSCSPALPGLSCCPLRKLALRGDLLPYCQFSFTDGNVHLKRVSLRVIHRLCFPSFHWTHSANRSKD